MKKLLALALSAVMCFGLASCGEEESNVLWLTVEDSQVEGALHVKLGKAFAEKMKAERGIDVTVKRSTFSNNDYGKSINTLYATGTLGDVVFTYDNYAPQYVQEGYFADLTSYIAESEIDLTLYQEDAMNSGKVLGDKIAYFPRSFDQVTIFINNEFFEDLGMADKIPTAKDGSWDWWTWTELLSLCQELRTAIDENNSEAQAEYLYPMDANLLWNAVYDPIIKSFGGYTVDVATMRSGLDKNNPDTAAYNNTLKAIEFMQDLVHQKYTPNGYGAFTAGNQAMAFCTRPSVSGAMEEGMDLSFAPLPTFDQAVTGIENGTTYVGYGSGGYALNANSSKKDLAWEFIQFAVSEEGQKIISSEGRCIPTLKSQLTENGDWTKFLDGVDQSAFLYNQHTLSLASFARGVKVDTEFTIYSKIRSNIMGELEEDKAAASVANALYNQIATYIK